MMHYADGTSQPLEPTTTITGDGTSMPLLDLTKHPPKGPNDRQCEGCPLHSGCWCPYRGKGFTIKWLHNDGPDGTPSGNLCQPCVTTWKAVYLWIKKIEVFSHWLKDPAFKTRHYDNHLDRLIGLAIKAERLLQSGNTLENARLTVRISQAVKDENNEESIKRLKEYHNTSDWIEEKVFFVIESVFRKEIGDPKVLKKKQSTRRIPSGEEVQGYYCRYNVLLEGRNGFLVVGRRYETGKELEDELGTTAEMTALELANNYNELVNQDQQGSAVEFGDCGASVEDLQIQNEDHLRKKELEKQQEEIRKQKAETEVQEEEPAKKPQLESRGVGFASLLGTFGRKATPPVKGSVSTMSPASSKTPTTLAPSLGAARGPRPNHVPEASTPDGNKKKRASFPSGALGSPTQTPAKISRSGKASKTPMTQEEFLAVKSEVFATIEQVQPAVDAFGADSTSVKLGDLTALQTALKTQVSSLRASSTTFPEVFQSIQVINDASDRLQPLQALLKLRQRKHNHPVYYPELSQVMSKMRAKMLRIPGDICQWEIMLLIQHLIRKADHLGNGASVETAYDFCTTRQTKYYTELGAELDIGIHTLQVGDRQAVQKDAFAKAVTALLWHEACTANDSSSSLDRELNLVFFNFMQKGLATDFSETSGVKDDLLAIGAIRIGCR